MPKYKKKIFLDFDGVLHSYTSRWTVAGHIPDPPVPGAIEALKAYVNSGEFHVNIWSSRCNFLDTGIPAMEAYLIEHGMTAAEMKKIVFCKEFKPQYHVFIDDRNFRFEGKFPTTEEILEMKQWNK
jgi:hypothetical protein